MESSVLTLADLVEAIKGIRPDNTNLPVSEAVVDSRQAIPASLFIATAGEKTDGHAFIQAAFNKGAHLALIDKEIQSDIPVVDLRSPLTPGFVFPEPPFALMVDNTIVALQQAAAFWRSKFNLQVIGITGSVGKSTTKELTSELLGQRFHTLKNQGNYNNEIGLPLTLLQLSPAHQCAVLEMGFYQPGDIEFLCNMAKPQVGIVTNIGTVHASRSKTQKAIAQGKSELVQALPASPEGTAILNLDDPLVAAMASQTSANVLCYGLNPQADLWADQIESHGLDGIRFRIHSGHESFNMHAPLIGSHSVHTILRAVAAALVEGLSWGEIVLGLQQASSQLRLLVAHTRQGALLLDDTYNASPESMLAALNLLAELPGRKIAVLGGMNELGQYEAIGHQKVGVRVAEVADQLITYQQNAKMISTAALQAGLSSSAVVNLEDSESVVSLLDSSLTRGDVVLIKGAHGLRMDKIVQALEIEE